jgi:hypothetical protein
MVSDNTSQKETRLSPACPAPQSQQRPPIRPPLLNPWNLVHTGNGTTQFSGKNGTPIPCRDQLLKCGPPPMRLEATCHIRGASLSPPWELTPQLLSGLCLTVCSNLISKQAQTAPASIKHLVKVWGDGCSALWRAVRAAPVAPNDAGPSPWEWRTECVRGTTKEGMEVALGYPCLAGRHGRR